MLRKCVKVAAIASKRGRNFVAMVTELAEVSEEILTESRDGY